MGQSGLNFDKAKMKHFQDQNTGTIFAFEDDGSQDGLITPSMVSIDALQLAALLAPPPKTTEQAKYEKNAAINAARMAANQSHFTFQGKQIAADQLSRSDIDAMHGAVLMLGGLPAGFPGAWKTKDNSYVPIPDVATWGAFYGAMVAQGSANFANSQALKAQIAAATTPEEVEAVPNW